jgi:hypothetical protein
MLNHLRNFVREYQWEDLADPVKTLVQEYGWVHLSLGLLGNAAFFIGSILLLPGLHEMRAFAIWLFVIGSFLMMVGALGRLLVSLWQQERQ